MCTERTKCTFIAIGQFVMLQKREKIPNWFKLEIFGNDRYLMTSHRERWQKEMKKKHCSDHTVFFPSGYFMSSIKYPNEFYVSVCVSLVRYAIISKLINVHTNFCASVKDFRMPDRKKRQANKETTKTKIRKSKPKQNWIHKIKGKTARRDLHIQTFNAFKIGVARNFLAVEWQLTITLIRKCQKSNHALKLNQIRKTQSTLNIFCCETKTRNDKTKNS